MNLNKKRFILLLIFAFTFHPACATTTDQPIAQLLKAAPPTNRINFFSAALLNKPYIIEPLGEGTTGEFNQAPLYRLDGFDCQTFVETVMALRLADNLADFKALLTKIRYKNGDVSFTNRNHFPSADWLPHNEANGFITDITTAVAGKNNIAVARAYINRQNWYRHLPAERIKISGFTPAQVKNKLAQLHAQDKKATNTWAMIDYIPRQILINEPTLLNKIPDGAIILIVKQPPAQAKVGTDMNVTHMGFAIWRNNTLYLRAASTQLMRVVDIPLMDYLQTEAAIKGISLWRIKKQP